MAVEKKEGWSGWWWALAAVAGATLGALVGAAIGYATYEPPTDFALLDLFGPDFRAYAFAFLGLLPGIVVGLVLWALGGLRALLAASGFAIVVAFAGFFGGFAVTDDPGHALDPTYSPDGRKIAFVRAEGPGDSGPIYVMNADGSGQRPLTSCCSYDPAWSPDGTRIAFVGVVSATSPRSELRHRGGKGELWVMNADGSNQHSLTRNWSGGPEHPTWSPDGLKIAVTADDGTIWIIDTDRRNRHQPTQRTWGWGLDPAWSPDGRRIAAHQGSIFTINSDGTAVQVSHRPRRDSSDRSPAWSPDGSKIAFVRQEGEWAVFEVFVVDADGNNERQLTKGQGWSGDNDPAWSPDGRKIAFERAGDIYVMNADGSDQRRLTR